MVAAADVVGEVEVSEAGVTVGADETGARPGTGRSTAGDGSPFPIAAICCSRAYTRATKSWSRAASSCSVSFCTRVNARMARIGVATTKRQSKTTRIGMVGIGYGNVEIRTQPLGLDNGGPYRT
jgi:hypothetical protein